MARHSPSDVFRSTSISWTLVKKRLITMLSTATITRRFVGLSAITMCVYAHYPLADPTSHYSLSLAQGTDSVPIQRDDLFAVNVREIATRVGVKNAENLSIRIGDETSGASLGSNLTIRSRGACIILPRELYEAFHATPALRQQYKHEIPTKDEINFVLAHESAHIARNHSIISGTFLPISVVASCFAIRRVPNKLVASVVGCLGLIGGNLLLSWRLEHEADHIAAETGFGTGGIHCFQRKLSRNCELRTLLNTRMITKEGNYLGDTSHPLLTSRIEHLKRIVSGEFSHAHESHSCRYCLRV